MVALFRSFVTFYASIAYDGWVKSFFELSGLLLARLNLLFQADLVCYDGNIFVQAGLACYNKEDSFW